MANIDEGVDEIIGKTIASISEDEWGDIVIAFTDGTSMFVTFEADNPNEYPEDATYSLHVGIKRA